MSYTKGEWEIKVVDATIPKHRSVYARIEPSVGFVGWDSMGVYEHPGDGKQTLKTLSKEALANAHLIAAAPDMYEALKDMVDPDDCSVDHHGYCQTHGWLQSGLCPHFRAKLALIKAEGK
jgi:hypothetical protein